MISTSWTPQAAIATLEAASRVEMFGVVTNLLDKDPPIVVTGGVFGLETNAATFDTIGRRFTIGIRIN